MVQIALPGRASERGTTIVESAIIMLAFFMFLFGIMEAGRFINQRQALTNAAREGARFAVAPLSGTDTLPSTGEIQAVVDQYLSAASMTGATVLVDPAVTVATGSVNTVYTRVQVQRPYQVISISAFEMVEITLTGEALMRNETSE